MSEKHELSRLNCRLRNESRRGRLNYSLPIDEDMTQKKDTKKILVVDDEQSMCSMLVKFLRSAGYNCDSTTDPINALSMLQRDGF